MAKTVNDVLKLLGGLECGACGYGSCLECAQAIVAGKERASACVMIDDDTQKKIDSM